MPSSSSPSPPISLEHTETEHLDIFRQAFYSVMRLPDVESTYAQIVDGLPLRDVYRESHWPVPAVVAAHECLCPGALERVRAVREQVDVNTLLFHPEAVQAYQNNKIGSMAFYLRLIELLAVACHQMAAALYERNDSLHSRAVLEAAMAGDRAAVPGNRPWERDSLPQNTYLFNRYYEWPAQYPRGVADVVGYWAETRIFGGVAVFDRGTSDRGCEGVYFHSDRKNYGNTLYPPTEAQLHTLLRFLHPSSSSPTLSSFSSSAPPSPLSPPPAAATPSPCPLPITPSQENRWRWDAGYAFLYWHIYRDRYERYVPSNYRPYRHKISGLAWPEINDDHVLMLQTVAAHRGEAVDEAAKRQAEENLKKITPTSPRWHGELPKSEDKKASWKPPYFLSQN
ncbi:hypothetical protein SPI_04302 [Niveomyces insectorum RCEF 264]|uniref:Uncharacterized protein n=1 Tax=Niveomyces insectorum RCEF 264 TaxID=1081102 RepID=A0A162J289_9HYPO|nr:hypothetical protein SPI_04302 [Niveomyces insectorum RCEF 264]